MDKRKSIEKILHRNKIFHHYPQIAVNLSITDILIDYDENRILILEFCIKGTETGKEVGEIS